MKDMADHTVVHFEIPAKDVEKISKFYSELFGWKIQKVEWMDYWLVETVPIDDQGRPIRPEVNGGLYKKTSRDDKERNYIQVESVDEYIDKVVKLGGKIIVPKMEVPKTGFTAIAADPDGNVFGLFEPIPM